MGGWSGGVYTRFRNWVNDKANSINPQAALFDQEDDGFAAGLNNCVTKDGLNKPSAAMDFNGQNLTGVLNFANTGTVSLVSGKLTISLNGNLVLAAPASGTAFALTGFAGAAIANFVSGSAANASVPDFNLSRSGSTANTIQQGPNLTLNDTTNSTASAFQHSGGQTELWQFNGAWFEIFRVTSARAFQIPDASGAFADIGFKSLPVNTQGGNYTLVVGDRGRLVVMNGASGSSLTVPNSVFAAGDVVSVLCINSTATYNIVQGSGMTMFLGGAGVTSGSRVASSVSLFTLTFSGASSCIIQGSGIS